MTVVAANPPAPGAAGLRVPGTAGSLALEVRVDPEVAETAVRAVMDSTTAPPEVIDAHHARRDAVYEIAEGPARDAAFARLAMLEFESLALATPLVSAIAEHPGLAGRARVLLIGRARGRQDEGVTCEPAGQHLGVRIDPARFADGAQLLGWARHAMGHAQDTLDPSFAFEPGGEEGPGARGAAVATRLHDLWDVTVDARLAAAGHLASAAARRRHRERLAAHLPGVAEPVVDAVLDRLWEGPRPPFRLLLAWAERPADLVRAAGPVGATLPWPDRCPLCGFPGDDVRTPGPATAALVSAEYPDWRPELGLCGRCGDRFLFSARLGGRS